MSPEILQESVRRQFAKKLSAQLLQTNLDTISELATFFTGRPVQPLPFSSAPDPLRMLVNGNDAIALGMVAAGIGVYTAYPMTPATSVMNVLADCGPQMGIAVDKWPPKIQASGFQTG